MVEPTENFILSIQIPVIGIGISLGINAVATGFINDDDGMIILVMM